MADLKFLYGPSYIQLAPPKEWEEIEVNATFNFTTTDANINTNKFTFVDSASTFIKQWLLANGSFNGMPFRIQVQSDVTTTIVTIFDGYISLIPEDLEIDSVGEPLIYKTIIIEINNNPTILDKAATTTQGQLVELDVIVNSDYIPVPDIIESKKNIRERAVILAQLLFDTITALVNIIQQVINAIADTIGVSFILGLLELVLAFSNAVLVINQLVDMFIEHKNLFFPAIEYRKGIFLKTVLEKGFGHLGYDVEFGIIEEELNCIAYESHQTGIPGWFWSTVSFPGEGILKAADFGYTLLESVQVLDFLFNIQVVARGNTVHLKTKRDPYWNTSPLYIMPNDIQIEITKQYDNGNIRRKPVKGTFFGEYAIDESDAHTLTEKADDSIEVRRTATTILNEKMFNLGGLNNVKIPLALCVRKKPFDNLLDLFTGITDEFDALIEFLQGYIDEFQSNIQSGSGVGGFVSDLLAFPPIALFFQNRTGVLKIEDDAFSVPKLLCLELTQIGNNQEYRIPENFKEILGWSALYEKWHSYDSPAIEQDFNGQWIQFKNVKIDFSPDDYVNTKLNSHFDFRGLNAKFTSLTYNPNGNFAVVSGEYQQVFDNKITETVIQTT